jgi:hypothetical protein
MVFPLERPASSARPRDGVFGGVGEDHGRGARRFRD